jgi:hypothetical protein
MRNYFKMNGLWLHGHAGAATAELVAWGGSDEVIDRYMQPQIAEQRADFPNMVFDPHRVVRYFELNEANFAQVLNGPRPLLTQNYAVAVWNACALPPLSSSSVDFFLNMTAPEGESPRQTWSHGH